MSVWLVLLAAIVGGGVALGGQTQESFNIPGTESQDAIDHLAAVFPTAAGASVQIVYQASAGRSVQSAGYRTVIESSAKEVEKVAGVSSVLPPFSE